MIIVAIVAAVLAVQPLVIHYAVELVRSHDDYLWNEAVTVWGILNIALVLSIGLPAAMVLAAMRDQHDD
jgi:hypothetical protein